MKLGFRKNDRCEWGRWPALGLTMLVLITFWPAVQPAAAQDSEELFTPFFVAKNALPSVDQSLLPRFDGRREPPGPIEYQQIMRTAVQLIKEGHYRSAIVLLEPYRTKDDFLTQHAIGVAYVRVGRNQEAYEALLHAHRLNPTAAAPLLPAALACTRWPSSAMTIAAWCWSTGRAAESSHDWRTRSQITSPSRSASPDGPSDPATIDPDCVP